MRPLYATQLELSASVFPSVVDRVHDWITSFYDRTPIEESPDFCPIPDADAERAEGLFMDPVVWDQEGHHVNTRYRALADGQLYEVKWTRPSLKPSVDWHEQIRAAVLQKGSETRFGVRSSVEFPSFKVAPLDPGVIQRPRIIDRLVKTLDCRVGSTAVHASPKTVSQTEAAAFVEETLTSDARRLPAIVLVPLEPNDKPPRDPDWVQDRLLGLANVYKVTPEASETLAEQLGRVRGCQKGGARIYWPEFTRRAVPSRHPYFAPEHIETLKEEGQELEHLLFEAVTQAATERYNESAALRAFRQQLRKARREQLLQRTETLPDEWLEDYEAVLDENDRLSQEVEALEKQLQQAQENLQAVRRATPSGNATTITDAPTREDVKSPREAVHFAEEQFGEYIYVWKSAHRAASNCQYHNAPEIVDVLEAIAELARKYHENDGSVGPWVEHFERKGLDYALQESNATMGQYGDQRIFHDEDKEMEMQRHVTIGQGHDHCLQIFFDRIEDDKRFQVGYCGEHLDFATSRT